MKTNYLFPHRFKQAGWILLGLSLVLFIVFLILPEGPDSIEFFDCNVFSLFPEKFMNWQNKSSPLWEIQKDNIGNELFAILFILGAIFVGFSKEKVEDEYVAKIRMESLMWATYICYGLLIFCILFIYGFSFLYVMIVNLFALLVVFVSRFQFMLYKSKRLKDEK